MKQLQRITIVLALLLGLLMLDQRINSLTMHQAPGAGSRTARSATYWVTCPTDQPHIQRLITPLPDSRYYYSHAYGWFDSSHFDAGNPAKLIEDVATAVSRGGGTLTINQSVRSGLIEAGWQPATWPASLQMAPRPSSSSTWMFLAEDTWYLNQE
jgi:hypothetical protein